MSSHKCRVEFGGKKEVEVAAVVVCGRGGRLMLSPADGNWGLRLSNEAGRVTSAVGLRQAENGEVATILLLCLSG